jgi:hypothetical protein
MERTWRLPALIGRPAGRSLPSPAICDISSDPRTNRAEIASQNSVGSEIMIWMWQQSRGGRLSFLGLLTVAVTLLCGLSTVTPASATGTSNGRIQLGASTSPSLGPLPAGTFVNGRVMRTVVVDGGSMVISPPPPDSRPALGHTSAAANARASTTAAPGIIDPAGTALGLVHIASASARTSKSPSVQLAWVTVIRPQLGVSCLATEGTVEPSFHILVAAVSGSSAWMYTSRGTGPCGGAIDPPSLAPAAKIESIPWQGLSTAQVSASPPRYNWTIRYQLPLCGSVFDSPGIYFLQPDVPTLFVQVLVPLVSSRQCSEGTTTTTVFGPEDVPVGAAQHAPLGVHQF